MKGEKPIHRSATMPNRSHRPRMPSDTRAIWERATELDRARTAPHDGEAFLPAEPSAPSLPELLEVAREVGISIDSVLLSVAEGRLSDAEDLRPRRESPLWHRFLIEVRDALEVSLHLPLTPSDALEVVDAAMARPDYRMALEDRVGGEGDAPSVSVFRNPGGTLESSSFRDTLHLCDGRVVVVAIVSDPGGGSMLRLRMPLYERGMNLSLGGGAGVLGGAVGVSAGAAAGEAVVSALTAGAAGLLPLALVVAPAVLGAYGGFGLGVAGFRRLQRWGFGKGQTALNGLARVLELEARARSHSLPSRPCEYREEE
jgi:hypothetical protein